MSYKDWVTLIVCTLLTLMIVWVMYKNSSSSNDAVREDFDTEANSDKNYENRMFVLKTYESLGRKVPSSEELDRAAAMGDKVTILKYIISSGSVMTNEPSKIPGFQKNEKESERFTGLAEEDEVFGPVSIDADDVFSPFPIRHPAPAPPPPPSIIAAQTHVPAAPIQVLSPTHTPIPTHSPSVNTTSVMDGRGKTYIREMYMMLGKLDGVMDQYDKSMSPEVVNTLGPN